MKKEILLNITLTKEADGGYSAVCTNLDVASQGETIEEAKENVREAVELYLESAQELGIIDNVLEKLGIDKLKDGLNIPEVLKTDIPVVIAA